MGIHRFYHADRELTLAEGQTIELNSQGLSRFGCIYWKTILTAPFDRMNNSEQREHILESIRREPEFSVYPSRMQAFFGANSIEEARRFIDSIVPRPEHKIPVFEVFASSFWTLDMNWLDYISDPETRIYFSRQYWYAAISNNNPEEGERKPPLLEVMMELPVKVGKIVTWI